MVKTKKKKKFIDKHNAVTFHLVNRSQKDPLVTDDVAPQHVLKPVESSVKNRATTKAEERKFGVFFDDDYNYLQHLKTTDTFSQLQPGDEVFSIRRKKPDVASVSEQPEAKLQLPSSVFASEYEEEVGLLNRAVKVVGPQPDWDPDIVATLDDDFNRDESELEELDDDFVAQANATPPSGCSDDDDEEGWETDNSSDCQLRGNDFFDKQFPEEETGSRFTEYSMSSSVMRRNEGLSSLDNRFEKIFEEYDDEDIGCLDGEDIEGFVKTDSELFQQVLEDYRKQVEKEKSGKELKPEEDVRNGMEEGEDSSDCEEELVKVVLDSRKEKWDCESILSTYSTLYNHPKLITEPKRAKPIKVSQKTGLPLDVLGGKGLTKRKLDALNKQSTITSIAGSTTTANEQFNRGKNETPEEKKARKKEVKELRKERRLEKKANTLAFKEEKRKQEKVLFNLRSNLQGIKL